MEENGFGPRYGLDFDQMHGVWVSRYQFPGSYGRIAFREGPNHYWVRWDEPGYRTKVIQPASREDVEDLKMLKVQPEPWFVKCSHCGTYGLPLGYSKESLGMLLRPTI